MPESLFFCSFIKKETLAQVFFCEFCEISKNTFFNRTPLVAASAGEEILLYSIYLVLALKKAVSEFVSKEFKSLLKVFKG